MYDIVFKVLTLELAKVNNPRLKCVAVVATLIINVYNITFSDMYCDGIVQLNVENFASLDS